MTITSIHTTALGSPITYSAPTTQAGNLTAAAEYAAVTDALVARAECLRLYGQSGTARRTSIADDLYDALTDAGRQEWREVRDAAWNRSTGHYESLASELAEVVAQRRAIHAEMLATPEDRAASVVDLLAAGREVMGDTPVPAPRAVIVRNFRDMVTHDELAETAADLRAELTNARQASTVLAQRAEDQRAELETLRAELAAEKERAEAWHRVADRVTVEAQEQRAELADANAALSHATHAAGTAAIERDNARAELESVKAAARFKVADLAHRVEQLALTF